MKKTNLAEKIGFALILIGLAILLIQDLWGENPIQVLAKNNLLVSTVGMLVWALGYNKRQVEGRKAKNN